MRELKSDNYNPGLQGWRISADGEAEFQDGVFRGTIEAKSGIFRGTIEAKSGFFRGTIEAKSGHIGGFNINDYGLWCAGLSIIAGLEGGTILWSVGGQALCNIGGTTLWKMSAGTQTFYSVDTSFLGATCGYINGRYSGGNCVLNLEGIDKIYLWAGRNLKISCSRDYATIFNAELCGDTFPYSNNVYDLGSSNRYFYRIYSNYYYGKHTSISSFQNEKDCDLIKTIKTTKKKVKEPVITDKKKEEIKTHTLLKDGESKETTLLKENPTIEEQEVEKEYFDFSDLPDEVKEKLEYKDGFFNQVALQGLLIGSIKELINRVENLENKTYGKGSK